MIDAPAPKWDRAEAPVAFYFMPRLRALVFLL